MNKDIKQVTIWGVSLFGVWLMMPALIGAFAAFLASLYFGVQVFDLPVFALSIGIGLYAFNVIIAVFCKREFVNDFKKMVLKSFIFLIFVMLLTGSLVFITSSMPEVSLPSSSNKISEVREAVDSLFMGYMKFIAWLAVVIYPMIVAGIAVHGLLTTIEPSKEFS